MFKNLLFIFSSTLTLSACDEFNNKGAAVCFNSDLYKEGNQQVQATLDGNVVQRLDITVSEGIIKGNVAVLKRNFYLIENNKLSKRSNIVQTITTQIDKSNKQFIRLMTQEVDKDGNKTEVTLTPYYSNSFDFKEGDDSSITINKQVIKHLDNKVEAGSEYSTKRDFLGMKEITTPLGTFKTCHIRETIELINTQSEFKYSQVSDAFFAKNTGLLVKNHRTSRFGVDLAEEMSAVTFLLKARLGDKQYIASSEWLKAHNLKEMIAAD